MVSPAAMGPLIASSTRSSVTVSIQPPGAHRPCDSPAVATTIAFEAVTRTRSEGTMNVAAWVLAASRSAAMTQVARLPRSPRIVNDDIDDAPPKLMTPVTPRLPLAGNREPRRGGPHRMLMATRNVGYADG